MKPKLKPCPFCSNPTPRVLAHKRSGYPPEVWSQVDCQVCQARGPLHVVHISKWSAPENEMADARRTAKTLAADSWNRSP
jgi:hypothetical protein